VRLFRQLHRASTVHSYSSERCCSSNERRPRLHSICGRSLSSLRLRQVPARERSSSRQLRLRLFRRLQCYETSKKRNRLRQSLIRSTDGMSTFLSFTPIICYILCSTNPRCHSFIDYLSIIIHSSLLFSSASPTPVGCTALN